MGLDNIPNEYPCVRAGTAVKTPNPNYGQPENPFMNTVSEEIIDCEATREIGPSACPWMAWMERTSPGSPTYGIFGTPCWFRGKITNWMFDRFDRFAPSGDQLRPEAGFYGDDYADPNLSVDYCLELANWMADHAEAYAMACTQDPDVDDVEAEVRSWRFAAEWLRFAANEGGGARAWY
jgi:hypothetical protein